MQWREALCTYPPVGTATLAGTGRRATPPLVLLWLTAQRSSKEEEEEEG
jgi:hypothetical protein